MSKRKRKTKNGVATARPFEANDAPAAVVKAAKTPGIPRVVPFETVRQHEFQRIEERRKNAFGQPPHGTDAKKDLVGLALSGGGIRSAMFNLGILQALERLGLMRYVDYLSTVSGGGYIGGYYTARASRLPIRDGDDGTDAHSSGRTPLSDGDEPDAVADPANAPRYTNVIHRFNFLARPFDFYYQYIKGLVLNGVAIGSCLLMVTMLVALLYRMVDQLPAALPNQSEVDELPKLWNGVTIEDHMKRRTLVERPGWIDRTGLGILWTSDIKRPDWFTNDLTRALAIGAGLLVPCILLIAASAFAGTVGDDRAWKQLRRWRMKAGKLAVLALVVGVVVMLSNFDTTLNDYYTLSFGSQFSGRSAPSTISQWVVASGGLVQSMLAIFTFLASRRFLATGRGTLDPTISKALKLVMGTTVTLPALLLIFVFSQEDFSDIKAQQLQASEEITEHGYWAEHRLRELVGEPERRTITETQSLIAEARTRTQQEPRGRSTSIFWEVRELVRHYGEVEAIECEIGKRECTGMQEADGKYDDVTVIEYEKTGKASSKALARLICRFFSFNPRMRDAALKIYGDSKTDESPHFDRDDLLRDPEEKGWIEVFRTYVPTTPSAVSDALDPDQVRKHLTEHLDPKQAGISYPTDGLEPGAAHLMPCRYLINFDQAARLHWFWWFLGVCAFSAVAINFNNTSLHMFYRDCLAAAFLDVDEERKGLDAKLHRLRSVERGYPYHVVSGTLNVPGIGGGASDGQNFVFTQDYCGSEATGYRPSKEYREGKTTLADALAISGAAFNPIRADSLITRAVMLLLNLRLGQWYRDPRHTGSRALYRLSSVVQRPCLAVILWSWLVDWIAHWWAAISQGQQSPGHRRRQLVFLSDGAHYDNLGLELLLERRCKLIIVSDVSNDAQFKLADFISVIRRVRQRDGIEFLYEATETDAPIPMDRWLRDWVISNAPNREATGVQRAGPKRIRKPVEEPLLIGRIKYPDQSDRSEYGWIIIYKPLYAELESMYLELYNYFRSSETFPHDPGIDQFFTEQQAEAYRLLGYHIGSLLRFEGDRRPSDEERESIDIIMSRCSNLKRMVNDRPAVS